MHDDERASSEQPTDINLDFWLPMRESAKRELLLKILVLENQMHELMRVHTADKPPLAGFQEFVTWLMQSTLMVLRFDTAKRMRWVEALTAINATDPEETVQLAVDSTMLVVRYQRTDLVNGVAERFNLNLNRERLAIGTAIPRNDPYLAIAVRIIVQNFSVFPDFQMWSRALN